jgi:hypothetical protein
MRTTVEVPADLVREAEARAARSAQAPRIVTFRGGGLQPGVDLDDSTALLDRMERTG